MVREGGPPTTLQLLQCEKEVVGGLPEPVLGMRYAHARGQTMTTLG